MCEMRQSTERVPLWQHRGRRERGRTLTLFRAPPGCSILRPSGNASPGDFTVKRYTSTGPTIGWLTLLRITWLMAIGQHKALSSIQTWHRRKSMPRWHTITIIRMSMHVCCSGRMTSC